MKRLALLILLASPALAQTQLPPEPATPNTVSVTGTGKSHIAPDRFTFTVGVQTQADTVEAAVNENNSRTAAVVAALKKAGATDQEIRTSDFNITPQQDYSQGRLPRILGYQVSNTINVTRKDVGTAGRLLQAAVGAGVNQASGLTFEVSDPKRGRDDGLRAAFDDAKSKAALLAAADGRTLGHAIAITEGTAAPQGPRPMFAPGAMRAAAVSEVPVETGTQELEYTVSVVFELR